MQPKGQITTALTDFILSILERLANAWEWAMYLHLIAPLTDPRRTFSAKQTWAMLDHLYRSEAHLARAIYKTALRLSGRPRRRIPIEPFFLPKLKSPKHAIHRMLRHCHTLQHSRDYAIRLARRWAREAEARTGDPLCDLRGAPTAATTAAAGAGGVGAEEAAAPKNGFPILAGPGIRAPPWARHSEIISR